VGSIVINGMLFGVEGVCLEVSVTSLRSHLSVFVDKARMEVIVKFCKMRLKQLIVQILPTGLEDVDVLMAPVWILTHQTASLVVVVTTSIILIQTVALPE